MQTVICGDVEVRFPYSPYDVQVSYMQAVMTALDNGGAALLESPTGTGKTMAVLCATLAWCEKRRGELRACSSSALSVQPPKVVYCSRTHAQLNQVMRELRCSPYSGVMAAVLGSRDHACVNPEVSRLPSSTSRSHACRTMRAENRCRFFNKLQRNPGMVGSGGCRDRPEDGVRCPPPASEEVLDIEDLVGSGRKLGVCPYFHQRAAAKDADIVLMPYNYIIDSTLRRSLPFPLEKNCIVVVDEAHNLPAVLSSEGCRNLTALSLAAAIQDCSRATAALRVLKESDREDSSATDRVSEQDVAALKIVLKRLEEVVEQEKVPTTPEGPQMLGGELVKEGEYIYGFLESALITPAVYEGSAGQVGMKDILSKTIQLLFVTDAPATGLTDTQIFLSNVFDTEPAELPAVKFVVQTVTPSGPSSAGALKKKPHRSIGFWHLETSALKELESSVLSLLLTSGTMSPLDYFAAEMKLSPVVVLKGQHVVQKDQVCGCTLTRGPAGERLNGSYAFRAQVSYRLALGMTLVNVGRQVDGGTLVFFPSYAILQAMVEVWKGSTWESTEGKTTWGMLSEFTSVFVEPSNAAESTVMIGQYTQTVQQKGKAVLLAVCRGRLSEGMNFSDRNARCVMVVGVPYANHTDLFVRLKRSFLTESSQKRRKESPPAVAFTGEDWYRSEAMRAVSQSIGRVIRHQNDFGTVILADERFTGLSEYLPQWLQPSMSVCHTFREAYALLVPFFTRRRAALTQPQRLNQVDHAPGVVGDGSSSSDIPEAIQRAREYVAARRDEAARLSHDEQRRRLELALETPRGGGLSTPAVSVSAVMSRVVAPPPPTHPPPTPTPTALSLTLSSKEFCSFLRSNLEERHYAEFKRLLAVFAALRMEVASHQRTDGADKAKEEAGTAERFRRAVKELQGVFGHCTAAPCGEVLEAFGRFIPTELRPQYHTVLSSQFK